MHKTRNVSELRTANRNGAFLCSTLRAKGLHSYLAQLAHSVPHTGTLSHCHTIAVCRTTIPFVNRLSCIFCSPPRWTHLHYSSLHCVRTRQGRADAGNIIAGHQQLLSAEKHAVGCCQGGGAEANIVAIGNAVSSRLCSRLSWMIC